MLSRCCGKAECDSTEYKYPVMTPQKVERYQLEGWLSCIALHRQIAYREMYH